MRISDWSSDVCSSDLIELKIREQPGHVQRPMLRLGRIDRRMAHQYIHDVEAARGNDVARRDIGIGQPLDLGSLRRRIIGIAIGRYRTMRAPGLNARSEERRVGKEVVSTGRSRWSP